MADFDNLLTDPAEKPNSVALRAEAFLSRLGISELDYSQVLDAAVAHATAARAAAAPAAQSWLPVGPRNVCGRVLALAQDPVSPLVYYVGTAHGGLWRSVDGGDTWVPLGGPEHQFPVSTIAIPEQAPTKLYVGTGSPLEAQVSGRGLYEVTVAGPRAAAVFRQLRAAPPSSQPPAQAASRPETRGMALRYGRIRMDPDDPLRFWVASQTGLWRCELHSGQPVFTLEFPPASIASGAVPPPLAAAAAVGGQAGYATDLVVVHDPRDDARVGDDGPPRYLMLVVAIDGLAGAAAGSTVGGLYRGRFDREHAANPVQWDSRLDVPRPIPDQIGTGTVSVAAGLVTLAPAAAGTRLRRMFRPGDTIEAPIGGAQRVVINVAQDAGGDLQMNVAPFAAPLAGASYRRVGGPVTFATLRVTACERQPRRLYAIAHQPQPFQQVRLPTPVYRSDDAGDSWSIAAEYLGGGQNQAEYNLVLEASPTDPDVLTAGLLDVFLSRDGGRRWQQILYWPDYNTIGDYAQHADQHAAMFDRYDRRRLWIGNDGGVSLSRDLQRPTHSPGFWRARGHGIQAGQFQHVAMHPLPGLASFSGGGLQDNGSWVGYGGPTWAHVGWADGGYIAFDPANPRSYVLSQQNGQGINTVVALSPRPGIVNPILNDLPEALAPQFVMGVTGNVAQVAAPAGFSDWLVDNAGAGSPFVPVIAQDRATPSQLLLGWRQAGAALRFNPITSAITAVPPATVAGAYFFSTAAGSGAPLPGLTPAPVPFVANGFDASAAAFGPTIAPAATSEGWVGFYNGSLIHATNAAGVAAWTPVGALPAAALGQPISGIAVHPNDPRIVVVCTVGRVPNASTQGRVCISFDRGLTWQDLTARTPASVTVTPAAPAALVAGARRQFTATARFADGSQYDATTSVAWASSNVALGGFSAIVGEEGQFIAVAAGVPNVTATLAGVASAALAQTVTAGNAPAAVLPIPARGVDPLSLPPGPMTSLAFEPVALPGRLFVGTLAGVYALNGLPCPNVLTIAPPSPLALPVGHTVQLRASLAFTVGAAVDATTEVDWTVAPAGIVTLGAAPLLGQVTATAVGAATVTARRGALSATIVINVAAAPGPVPAAPAAPAAMVAPPVTVAWQPFSNGLPLTLVNAIATHTGANRLRIATFGRGLYDIDLTPPAVAQNLFIRQTVVEDGRQPRLPLPLPDDPRLPAGIVGLDFTHAFDIRVDAPPYRLFDDRVDGVEFDEELGADTLHPTKPNAIYVQVHNNGRTAATQAELHLYFRASPIAAPIGAPPGVAIPPNGAGPDLGPVADFYNPPGFDPTGGGDPVAGTRWTRIGAKRSIAQVDPGTPVVERFDWMPPAALAGANVALLALVNPAAGQGQLPAAPVAGPGIDTFIPAERRAALRILAVGAAPLPDLYLRAAVDDDGLAGSGASVSALRSPDIIAVPAAPTVAGGAEVAFRDRLDARPQDHLERPGTNHLYVRVHNRGATQVHAEVEIFAVKVKADGHPDFAFASWIRITPVAPGKLELDVPANGHRLVEQTWDVPDPAPGHPSYILVAMVHSADTQDPAPVPGLFADEAAFMTFLKRGHGSDNVAARALRVR
ncbi:hypothetical protein RA210_U10131 [Rubrivivax sp. A210]|uniref:hypothetical protein n=1 Tax=Rubrivivax sp. A210 TaxID=2772301 RepID=UPI001917E667|nr:hypothetical protein [Rubrivivax sp. A210]CAD5366050.1 hypothetical protein RA210_U10131 [Rubrivivax sp. A210]